MVSFGCNIPNFNRARGAGLPISQADGDDALSARSHRGPDDPDSSEFQHLARMPEADGVGDTDHRLRIVGHEDGRMIRPELDDGLLELG